LRLFQGTTGAPANLARKGTAEARECGPNPVRSKLLLARLLSPQWRGAAVFFILLRRCGTGHRQDKGAWSGARDPRCLWTKNSHRVGIDSHTQLLFEGNMLTIWKPSVPKPNDKMPDVHEAAARAIAERKRKFDFEFRQIVSDITEITEVAVDRGRLFASNASVHRNYLDETILAAQKWLQDKGYEVRREHYGCSCSSHLRWSWEFKARQDNAAPVVLGQVERVSEPWR